MNPSIHTVDGSYRVLVDDGLVMRGWTIAYNHWLESNRVDICQYDPKTGAWVNVNGQKTLSAVRSGIKRGTYRFVINNIPY